jgi:hypothetical protein
MLGKKAAKIAKALKKSSASGEEKEAALNSNKNSIERMRAHGGSIEPMFFRGFLGETRGVWNEYDFNIDKPKGIPETKIQASAPESPEGVIEDSITEIPPIIIIRESLDSRNYEEEKVLMTKPLKTVSTKVPK